LRQRMAAQEGAFGGLRKGRVRYAKRAQVIGRSSKLTDALATNKCHSFAEPARLDAFTHPHRQQSYESTTPHGTHTHTHAPVQWTASRAWQPTGQLSWAHRCLPVPSQPPSAPSAAGETAKHPATQLSKRTQGWSEQQ
jgi:hypothetical protein